MKSDKPTDVVLKTSLSDALKQSGTDVVELQDYFGFLDVDFSSYGHIQLSQEAAVKLKNKLRSLRTGTHAAVPLMCFESGTLITMSDYSVKPIEDIVVGDLVVTHTGKAQVVTRLMNRQFSGNMIRFNIGHGGKHTNSAWSTPNHEYFSRRVSHKALSKGQKTGQALSLCPVCQEPISINNKHHGDKLFDRHIKKYTDPEHLKLWSMRGYSPVVSTNWVNASDMQVGDFIGFPIRTISQDISSKESLALATTLGYYLAEGSLSLYKRNKLGHLEGDSVQYSFHYNEDEYRNELTDAWNILGANTNIFKYPKRNVGLLTVSGRRNSLLMFGLGGRYSHSKILSKEIFDWGAKAQKQLLNTYIKGDGTIRSRQLSFTTISRNLAWQLYAMSVNLGLMPGYPVEREGSDKGVKKKRYNSWHVYLPVKSMVDFGSTTNKFDSSRYYADGFYWRKISAIENKQVENITVYNFSVDQDESYIANGFIVHNCGGPRCPIVATCPLTVYTNGQIDNKKSEWPVLAPCPIESHVMAFRIKSYVYEYDVDVDMPSTLALITKLAELDIYEMRVDVQLASSTGNASTLLREEVGSIHQPSGTTYETIKIHPLWEIKNQIHKQRMELLDALIGTPKAKTKAAVSMGEKTEQASDLAIEMSKLRNRLDIMQSHSRNGTLDADFVPAAPTEE